MKYLMLALSILTILLSCDKTPITIEKSTPNIDFQTQILDGYFVTSIAFDSQGNAWIGTFKQGLIKYSSEGPKLYNAENSILPDSTVIYDIAIDSKDNVWVATEGLLKYNGADFTLYNTANSPIPENRIPAIAIDTKDNIWMSSSLARQGGLVKFNGRDWSVFTPENSKLPVHAIQSIAIDHNDDVWVGLGEIVSNTWIIKVSGNELTTFSSVDIGFSPYHISNLQVNQKNQLVGAIDYSYSSLYTSDRPQAFIFDGASIQLLQHDSIFNTKFISMDQNDNIWFGLYGGFAVRNGEDWTIDRSTFSEEGVFAIEQAPDEKIWIGTGNGIYINN